jgi:hypothetical protein
VRNPYIILADKFEGLISKKKFIRSGLQRKTKKEVEGEVKSLEARTSAWSNI